MTEAKIYAKQQQIKLIDNILCSLCSIELNSDGRKYLKRTKEKISKEVEYMKREQESERSKINETAAGGYNLNLPLMNKTPW